MTLSWSVGYFGNHDCLPFIRAIVDNGPRPPLIHDVLDPPSPVGCHRAMICGTGGVMAMPKWLLECNLTQMSDTSSLYNHSILWNKNTFNAVLLTGFYWYIRCDFSEAGLLPVGDFWFGKVDTMTGWLLTSYGLIVILASSCCRSRIHLLHSGRQEHQ